MHETAEPPVARPCAASWQRSAQGFVLASEFGLLAVNLVWSCLCLGAYRPETQTISFSLGVALVVLHLLGRRFSGDGQGGVSFSSGDWFLLGFLFYAGASMLFLSPFVWSALADFLGWAQLFAVFWIVRRDFSRGRYAVCLAGLLMTLAFVAVFLACYQRFVDPSWLMLGRHQAAQFLGRSSGFFGIPNSLGAFLLLLLPLTVLGALSRGATLVQRVFFAYAATVFSLGLVLSFSRGAWLALIAAVCFWVFLLRGGNWAKRLGWMVGTLVVSGVLLLLLHGFVPQARERIDIFITERGEPSRPILWRASLRLFSEQPLLGTGAGSFNVLFEKHRPEYFQREPQWAHNDYLNTLSDYGAVGFLLLGCGVFLLVKRARTIHSQREAKSQAIWFRQGLLIGLLAYALQLFVDFNFKLPGLAMAFAITAGLVCGEPVMVRAASLGLGWGRRLGLSLVACGIATAFVLFALPMLRAEGLRYAARQRIDESAALQEDPEVFLSILASTENDLRRAVELCPTHAPARADLSYLLTLKSRYQPGAARNLGAEALEHALCATQQAPLWPEAWLRKGVAMDLVGKWFESGSAYVQALELAPASVNTRYYLAYHYSLKGITHENARALLDTCLRLDPSHAPAQALRKQLDAVGQPR